MVPEPRAEPSAGPHIQWQVPLPSAMNLNHLFELSFSTRGEEAALEYADRSGVLRVRTFSEVKRGGRRMARVLEQRGLATGDRMCVYLGNCVEMIDLYLACLQLGVIFVPINILYREREIGHILKDAEPKATVTDGDFPGPLPEVLWQAQDLAAEAELADGDRTGLR